MRLSEKLTEPAGWTAAKTHSIIALAFSPDGGRLAATVDAHYQARVHKTHLLIIDIQSPHGGFRQFDIETCGQYLAWSPDGGALLVCGHILRLDDGSSCDLLQTLSLQVARTIFNSSFWLSADRTIRADRTITDLSCRPVETWAMPGSWYVAGTVPATGWMLLSQLADRAVNGRTVRLNDYAIADRDSHALTSGVLMPGAYLDNHTILAQGARMLCSELVPAGGYKSALHCWNLPDGQVIPVASELRSYGIVQTSRSSPRVVAERWGYHFFGLMKEVPDMLNLSVVDLRSGRHIASLKPRPQREFYSPQGDRYFQYALSPNGDLLAEGGDGVLSLYRLP
jgi:WD40 repeat protein